MVKARSVAATVDHTHRGGPQGIHISCQRDGPTGGVGDGPAVPGGARVPHLVSHIPHMITNKIIKI